jgi:hypothetical protein
MPALRHDRSGDETEGQEHAARPLEMPSVPEAVYGADAVDLRVFAYPTACVASGDLPDLQQQKGSFDAPDTADARWQFENRMVPYASATNCFVSQPLSLGAFDRSIGAFGILDSNSGPMAVAEIELGEVAVQVLLAYVEIATVNATLQEREKAFHGIGMGFDAIIELARPFLSTMINCVVTGKALTDAAVGAQLVSHQPTLGVCGAIMVSFTAIGPWWTSGIAVLIGWGINEWEARKIRARVVC